jgi:hypothetical protein
MFTSHHDRNIYAARGYPGSKPAGDPPQEEDRETGDTMRKSIILVAGIFIACVLCAGIPAVSASENPKATGSTPAPAVPQVTPAVIAPATTPSATPDHPVNTTPATVTDQKNWWENVWPLNAIIREDQNKTAVPQGTTTPAVTAPATPQQSTADNQKDTINQKDATDRNVNATPIPQGTAEDQKDAANRKVTATPTPQAPRNP